MTEKELAGIESLGRASRPAIGSWLYGGVLVLGKEIRRLWAIEAAARRVRTERNTFLASMAGSGCERSASLEAAERDLDALLDAKETE